MTTVDPSCQTLPSKEAALFKTVITYHEHRQYKKGLKVCEQILKKCPVHAETMSMKGLFLGLMDKKEEGYETAKQAIRYNFKSHVCWHVYGLLYRNDKNYEEAQKCYKTALKFDPLNNQILRDLAVLQLQTGNYEGHVETRSTILQMNPQVKSSWIAMVLGYHLCENYEDALKTLDQFLDNVSEATGVLRFTVFDNEMAELHLYKAMILEEAGMYEECFKMLSALDFRGGDILKYRGTMARMLLKTGRLEEARTMFRKLLSLVPDNLEYLRGIEQSSEVNLNDESEVARLISILKNDFPKSNLAKSHYLKYLSGDLLEVHLKEYCLPLLKKGAPSVFGSIQSLYTSEENIKSIENVLNALLNTFNNLEDKKAEFWCHYFLAQHFDRLVQPDKALHHLDAAYKLDERIPDLFLIYAKVLKHSDKLADAVFCTEHARKMDLGDRYLNSKSVKYMLRAGRFQTAQETMSLFLKEGTLEKQMADLADIQCIWFDIEVGKCLLAKSDFVKAKVCFERILNLFDDFVDDQLDFHNYALRKLSLTYYVELMRYERVIYREKAYLDAALSYFECLEGLKRNTPIEEAMGSLTVSDTEQRKRDALTSRLSAFHTNDIRVQHILFEQSLGSDDFTTALDALLRIDGMGECATPLTKKLSDRLDKSTGDAVNGLKQLLEKANFKSSESIKTESKPAKLSDQALSGSPFIAKLESA